MVQTSEKSFVLEIFLRLLKKESVRRNCQKCENSQANPNLLGEHQRHQRGDFCTF